ncbi:MAG: hypothetical protein M0R74_09850 [Dehalococcoidia bacterium]|nr:hypothetical protein [Dehalococcoidia bacterium]
MNRSKHIVLLAELEEDARLAGFPRAADLPALARIAAELASLAAEETPATALACGRQRLRAEFEHPAPEVASRSWQRAAALGTAATLALAGLVALGSSAGGYALPGGSLWPWSQVSAPPDAVSPVGAALSGNAGVAEEAAYPASVDVVLPEDMEMSGAGLSFNLAEIVQTGGELASVLQQNGVVIGDGDGDEVHIDLPGGSVDVVPEPPSVGIETESATVQVDSANGGSVQIEADGISTSVTGGTNPSVTFATDNASIDVQGGSSPSVDVQAGDAGIHLEPGQPPEFEGIDVPTVPATPVVPVVPPVATPSATVPAEATTVAPTVEPTTAAPTAEPSSTGTAAPTAVGGSPTATGTAAD